MTLNTNKQTAVTDKVTTDIRPIKGIRDGFSASQSILIAKVKNRRNKCNPPILASGVC